MNRIVLVVIVLTIVALVVLTLFSFGPLSNSRKRARINPTSLKPTTSEQVVVSNKSLPFSAYHNRDLVENCYTIKLPQDWQMHKAGEPGKYSLTFSGGTATVKLLDVPDNTTLELYVLSQEEPRFKRSVPGYKREGYKKVTVDGNQAYQLAYVSKIDDEDYRTICTYVTGQDKAGVITLTARKSLFAGLEAVYSSIIESFHWEKK
jgi:hypothetical protein